MISHQNLVPNTSPKKYSSNDKKENLKEKKPKK